ncbi:hypothetical protein DENSPDRAFT_861002 [Dentipellis sp. KUC8613]|nr:hypothetical protein DENSPDRAFT_861002 [Dentipellis sp. KUC8613]
MSQFASYNALLFSSDGSPPRLVELKASLPDPYSSQSKNSNSNAQIPHPEVYMEHVAQDHQRPWGHQPVEALDGMNKRFTEPYMVFYPTISRDGLPFPVNLSIREIQGNAFKKHMCWCGDIIIAKYQSSRFTVMKNMTMADYPLLKNWLAMHLSPVSTQNVEPGRQANDTQ